MALETMLAAARDMPSQVSRALGLGQAVSAGQIPKAIVLTGMGGSAMGGTLAAALLQHRVPVPVVQVRDHHVPPWAGPDTVVIATSYSGNTHETLDAVRDALRLEAEVIAISTGGALSELVSDEGGAVLTVPDGLQPRAAIGWLLGANHAAICARLGIDQPALADAAQELAKQSSEMSAEDGAPALLAAELGAGPVGIVGHDVLGVVAERWAGEMNENAKQLAFHATLPEMAHNQIVGWAGSTGDASLVLVRRAVESTAEGVRLEALSEHTSKGGAEVYEVRVSGTLAFQVLEGVLFGDLVSLHLAAGAGIDPEPVDVIQDLKSRLDDR